MRVFHGVNQAASAVTNDKFNLEKKILGEKGYVIYDALLGIFSMKYAAQGLIKSGIKNTYVKTATNVVRRGKGYVEKSISVNLHVGKTLYDVADNTVGIYSLKSNYSMLKKYELLDKCSADLWPILWI